MVRSQKGSRAGETVILMGVGDVRVNRDNPESIFEGVIPASRQADILFGNCETPYSDRGSPNPISSIRSTARNAPALKYAGFHVMSFANNHSLDYGYEAFFDTLDLLRQNDIVPIGAGSSIDEARKPAIMKRNGTRVGFLAYAFVTHTGYEAGPNKAGTAVMKAYTYYHQVEDGQAGTPPKIFTFADPDDLEVMRQDIQRLKGQVDVVVVSFHWGLHFVEAVIAMYENEVSRVAIDNGADLILGHHQHILKGINVYRGKVVFHGLGNFAHDAPISPASLKSPHFNGSLRPPIQNQYPGVLWQDPDPTWQYPTDSRKTVLVKALISEKKIQKVSYLPCLINANRQPMPLKQGTPQFDEAVAYMEKISHSQGLNVELVVQGDEIVIRT